MKGVETDIRRVSLTVAKDYPQPLQIKGLSMPALSIAENETTSSQRDHCHKPHPLTDVRRLRR
jgi:hypothetical protein